MKYVPCAPCHRYVQDAMQAGHMQKVKKMQFTVVHIKKEMAQQNATMLP